MQTLFKVLKGRDSMSKKNISICTSLLISAIILSVASCSNKSSDVHEKKSDTSVQSSESVSETSVRKTTLKQTTTTPASNSKGNKITVIEVTDKNGNIVTDSNGSAVTEIVAADSDNNIITNSDGSFVRPDTSINTTLPSVTKPQAPLQSSETDISDAYVTSYGSVNFTWLCSNKENSLPGNGQFAVFTFKIKDNAQKGDYNIDLLSAYGDPANCFVKYDGTKKNAYLDGGTISVGTGYTLPDNTSDTPEIYANLTNASGNPGDTVTIYMDISNNYPGVIGCCTMNIKFDNNALEIMSITQGSLFDTISKGTFATSMDQNLISQ